MNKAQNRILLGLAITALVAIFCYQVAYGMSETVTNGTITATLTAPPGSTVNNFTIRQENSSNPLVLTNPSSIWTIVNSTSGSRGTIVFYTSCHEVFVKVYSYTTCATTFDRFLNDRVLKGTVNEATGLVIEQGEPMTFCYGNILHPYVNYLHTALKPGCFNLNPTIVTHDHIQFKDMHGGTIDLWPAIP
ncbi:MAG: hypothetical protein WA323_07070 [Candidatus Nitrosopolaris sp.]|jgi:hypothetical protein